MSKKADKFIEKYIVGKDDWLLKHKEVISKLLDEYESEQLTLTDVGCGFSIGFAQYIAEEHYILVNVEDGKYYWGNEESCKTSEQLLKDYKETLT